MFRYERPQKGRFRQFHQIDVELIGVAQPQADIEVIALGRRILDALGVRARTVLELNTLGDAESRTAYRDALVGYFSGHAARLSEDSLRRLERNPLRILDSKDEGDQRIAAGAPPFGEYLNAASRDFFAEVCGGLDRLGIDYRLNPRLVRGLDYYTHTAFEFVTADLGAQGTVMGGGRYDGLVETMGGPAMPGVGWAAGIERLAMLIAEPPAPPRPIAVVPIGAEGEQAAAQNRRRPALGGLCRRSRLFRQSRPPLATSQQASRARGGDDRRKRDRTRRSRPCATSTAARKRKLRWLSWRRSCGDCWAEPKRSWTPVWNIGCSSCCAVMPNCAKR